MKRTKYNYTLVELIVAMGVFSLILLMLVQLFNSSQKLWIGAEKKNEIYSNARVALDLIGMDIQCMLYNNDSTPVTAGIYPLWLKSDSELNVITATPIKSSGATSSICEVRYARADGTTTYKLEKGTVDERNASEGTLLRSCTGDDSTSTLYNFSGLPYGDSGTATTRVSDIFEENSSASYEEVITNVVSLKFYLLGKSGVISPMALPTTKEGTPMPQMVKIELELLDNDSWKKWKDTGNTDFKDLNVRKFSRTIFLGSRRSN